MQSGLLSNSSTQSSVSLVTGRNTATCCHCFHSRRASKAGQSKNAQKAVPQLSSTFCRPSRPLSFTCPLAPARLRRQSVTTAASSDNDVQLADRLTAAIVYLVPLMDGLRYGRFFFQQFPFALSVLQPIFPIFRLYTSVPFASLIVFFGIYSGIINNQNFTRYVRYNAMQAILLSIILVLASVLLQLFPKGTLTNDAGLAIFVNLNNAVWLYIAVCFIYAVGSCLTGAVARLPLVSNAAEQRVP